MGSAVVIGVSIGTAVMVLLIIVVGWKFARKNKSSGTQREYDPASKEFLLPAPSEHWPLRPVHSKVKRPKQTHPSLDRRRSQARETARLHKTIHAPPDERGVEVTGIPDQNRHASNKDSVGSSNHQVQSVTDWLKRNSSQHLDHGSLNGGASSKLSLNRLGMDKTHNSMTAMRSQKSIPMKSPIPHRNSFVEISSNNRNIHRTRSGPVYYAPKMSDNRQTGQYRQMHQESLLTVKEKVEAVKRLSGADNEKGTKIRMDNGPFTFATPDSRSSLERGDIHSNIPGNHIYREKPETDSNPSNKMSLRHLSNGSDPVSGYPSARKQSNVTLHAFNTATPDQDQRLRAIERSACKNISIAHNRQRLCEIPNYNAHVQTQRNVPAIGSIFGQNNVRNTVSNDHSLTRRDIVSGNYISSKSNKSQMNNSGRSHFSQNGEDITRQTPETFGRRNTKRDVATINQGLATSQVNDKERLSMSRKVIEQAEQSLETNSTSAIVQMSSESHRKRRDSVRNRTKLFGDSQPENVSRSIKSPEERIIQTQIVHQNITGGNRQSLTVSTTHNSSTTLLPRRGSGNSLKLEKSQKSNGISASAAPQLEIPVTKISTSNLSTRRNTRELSVPIPHDDVENKQNYVANNSQMPHKSPNMTSHNDVHCPDRDNMPNVEFGKHCSEAKLNITHKGHDKTPAEKRDIKVPTPPSIPRPSVIIHHPSKPISQKSTKTPESSNQQSVNLKIPKEFVESAKLQQTDSNTRTKHTLLASSLAVPDPVPLPSPTPPPKPEAPPPPPVQQGSNHQPPINQHGHPVLTAEDGLLQPFRSVDFQNASNSKEESDVFVPNGHANIENVAATSTLSLSRIDSSPRSSVARNRSISSPRPYTSQTSSTGLSSAQVETHALKIESSVNLNGTPGLKQDSRADNLIASTQDNDQVMQVAKQSPKSNQQTDMLNDTHQVRDKSDTSPLLKRQRSSALRLVASPKPYDRKSQTSFFNKTAIDVSPVSPPLQMKSDNADDEANALSKLKRPSESHFPISNFPPPPSPCDDEQEQTAPVLGSNAIPLPPPPLLLQNNEAPPDVLPQVSPPPPPPPPPPPVPDQTVGSPMLSARADTSLKQVRAPLGTTIVPRNSHKTSPSPVSYQTYGSTSPSSHIIGPPIKVVPPNSPLGEKVQKGQRQLTSPKPRQTVNIKYHTYPDNETLIEQSRDVPHRGSDHTGLRTASRNERKPSTVGLSVSTFLPNQTSTPKNSITVMTDQSNLASSIDQSREYLKTSARTADTSFDSEQGSDHSPNKSGSISPKRKSSFLDRTKSPESPRDKHVHFSSITLHNESDKDLVNKLQSARDIRSDPDVGALLASIRARRRSYDNLS